MATHSQFTSRAALEAADAQRAEYETRLKELVEIPSVSAQRDHVADIGRCVDAAVALVEAAGGTARVLRSAAGHPIVLGALGDERSLPTVTVYNHLDVQPADRERDGWRTDPFVFTIDGDVYRGRGTTDDKGPALAALFGARYARAQGVPLNVRFLWEFEEEIGSPSFEATVRANREALSTDSVIVSDTIWISRERPAAPAGLRGLQGFLLRLRTGERDEHSGVTGGAARNPLAELMAVVSACFDARSGEVKIPGFYDDVIPLTEQEREDFSKCGFSVEGFMKDHQFRSIRSRDALDVMQRIWARPTFEVHGVVGGYAGEGLKTVVPPFAEVKVSCRLVPAMTTQRTFDRVRDFVKTVNPDVEVVSEHGLEPYRGTTTGPLAEAVAEAMQFGFGRRPVFVREGGSIGAVLTMERELGVPVMFLGLSLPEHGYHAPNENFDWQQARGGIAAFADYFRRVSGIPRSEATRQR
jgi:acetylornithine deacetylase/succinyl-diaminopimelate desuccinylase-like protein